MTEITNLRGETTSQSLADPVKASVRDLTTRVGERVRTARERKGIPRRVLSEISGVSPRYLAQIEAGDGNISIGLLLRVAIALDHRIESLVAEDDPRNPDGLRVSDLFRVASADVQRAVLRRLSPAPTVTRRARRLCLVGLRGAGKSTLGRLAGQALDLPFVELNTEIEAQSGMPVNEVIALYGQEGYRRLEAQAVSRVIAGHDDIILAVAGGIVTEPETYNLLLGHFHSIWLRTSPDEHMTRVRAQGGDPEAMAQLGSILTSREALYGRALAQLDTSGQSIDACLGQLLALIRDRAFLA